MSSGIKQNSYKGDRLCDSWLTGITRPVAAVFWSNCQPTLPNIRILFAQHPEFWKKIQTQKETPHKQKCSMFCIQKYLIYKIYP